MIGRFLGLVLAASVAACAPAPAIITSNPPPQGRADTAPRIARSPAAAQASFSRAVARVEPVAESYCRERNPDFPARGCDFRFVITDDPRLGENAFQTLEETGRPRVTFTLALLRSLQNDDEVAFILGHEAGHQIARHIYQSSANQQIGALLLGGLLSATGQVSDASVQTAANIGGFLGGRAFSKDYELEADMLAVRIAARAGYDPVKGAAPFTRSETGSSAFLSTHPPSSQRYRTILAEAQRIGAR